MDFHIRFSSIKNMLTLCEKLTDEKVQTKDIEDILKHEDYKFEFMRYKGRVYEEEYINYLLRINSLNEKDITNMDLKAHHSYYKDLLNNLDFYREKLTELEEVLAPSLFDEQVSIALNGLPEDIKLPDLNFIFTIGIGQSFGYAYENGMHFDFLQLVKDRSLSEFCSAIAHEVHHVGINSIMSHLNLHTISLEGLFYLHFIVEGLAVKYCNNAEGILSKSIYIGAKNEGLDAFTWKYLNQDFYNTMTRFQKDIKAIRENKIKSVNGLNKLMYEYWMSPYTEEQNKKEIPKLKHSRLYSFGNDIWGIIHDCFGKSAVFETINNPDKFPTIFNRALDKIGYRQFKI
jgi:uncharacterized protein YjaZ